MTELELKKIPKPKDVEDKQEQDKKKEREREAKPMMIIAAQDKRTRNDHLRPEGGNEAKWFELSRRSILVLKRSKSRSKSGRISN